MNLINLLRPKSTATKKSTVIQLEQQTQLLAKKDIGDWRKAWQQAIDIENPRRSSLYAIYLDTLIDNHLSGSIEQRKAMTLQKAFNIKNKEGEDLPDLTAIFERTWFKDLISLALDSRYWGHSLIQLGDVRQVGDIRYFADVQLVPRHHVVPEYGVILNNPSDDIKQGYPYREGDLAKWCIEAGSRYDLGLLLKVTPQAISKKYMLTFWDQFGEVFGMPIRIAKTISRDENERRRIFNMLEKMGAKAYGVFQEGTEIEIKETSRGDAFNVYDKRIDRANSEMSKVILGQTMTLEDGSSKAQGEVHLDVLKNIVNRDADFIRDIVNGTLIPLMVSQHGFPLDGCSFEWDEAVDYTPEEQVRIEEMICSQFDIDPEYFQRKYSIPITGKKVTNVPPMKGFFD